MTPLLRTMDELRAARSVALHRARWCKQRGFDFYSDVAIARRFNRLLLRSIRRAA